MDQSDAGLVAMDEIHTLSRVKVLVCWGVLAIDRYVLQAAPKFRRSQSLS